METILRYEVLNELDSGRAFSMSFVTYDATRKKGGKLKTVTNWVKSKGSVSEVVRNSVVEASDKLMGNYRPAVTVNIYNPNGGDQHMTKVHLPLITIFNGKRVIN